jgi:hypothetical protein
MLTKKSSLVLITVRIKWFLIFLLVPLRCVNEVLEGFTDMLSLFRRVSGKVFAGMYAAENMLMLVQSYGSLDLVDVDVKSPEARVKVKVLLR